MSDNKTILKLYFEGYSQRQIAEMVKMSRKNSISPLIQAVVAQHLTLETIIDLSEEEINALLFPDKKYLPEYVQPDYSCTRYLIHQGEETGFPGEFSKLFLQPRKDDHPLQQARDRQDHLPIAHAPLQDVHK